MLHGLRHHRPRSGGVVVGGVLQTGLVAGLEVVDAAGLVAPADSLRLQFQHPAADAGDSPGLVEQRLGGVQRRLGQLALGDVHQRAGHPARAAVIAAADELAPDQRPDPVPGLVLQPAFVLEEIESAVKVLLEQRTASAQIVRVDQAGPGVDRR